MTHSLSRTPRRIQIQRPIFIYLYRTRSFRGFDGNQDQQGKASLSSRTRALSLVLDGSLIYESWQWILKYLSSLVVARLYHPQYHLLQSQANIISSVNQSMIMMESSFVLCYRFCPAWFCCGIFEAQPLLPKWTSATNFNHQAPSPLNIICEKGRPRLPIFQYSQSWRWSSIFITGYFFSSGTLCLYYAQPVFIHYPWKFL
jgi:hypothetical protein